MAELDSKDPNNYSFTIDESDGFAIRMWFGSTDADPFLYQPCYPNHTDFWESAEEASQWAELKIAELTNRDNPQTPTGRGVPGLPQMPDNDVLKDAAKEKLKALGFTQEELTVLLNRG
jgi:hypothetical protein